LILVDTSVLSLAFRRRENANPEPPHVRVLRDLIEKDAPIAIPGIVLQELLSGVRTESEFQRLQTLMEGFPLILATREHHLNAAKIANQCRSAGAAVSAVDCLIAAMAIKTRSWLLTTDEDFVRIASHCPLQLLGE
jgi:predicted nucleic acid-binding protein